MYIQATRKYMHQLLSHFNALSTGFFYVIGFFKKGDGEKVLSCLALLCGMSFASSASGFTSHIRMSTGSGSRGIVHWRIHANICCKIQQCWNLSAISWSMNMWDRHRQVAGSQPVLHDSRHNPALFTELWLKPALNLWWSYLLTMRCPYW